MLDAYGSRPTKPRYATNPNFLRMEREFRERQRRSNRRRMLEREKQIANLLAGEKEPVPDSTQDTTLKDTAWEDIQQGYQIPEGYQLPEEYDIGSIICNRKRKEGEREENIEDWMQKGNQYSNK